MACTLLTMFQDKKLAYGGEGMSYCTGRFQQNVIIVTIKSQGRSEERRVGKECRL